MIVLMHYAATAVIEAHGADTLRRDVAGGQHLTTLAFSEVGWTDPARDTAGYLIRSAKIEPGSETGKGSVVARAPVVAGLVHRRALRRVRIHAWG